MPAVVSTKSDLIPAGRGARDSHSDSICLSACACKPNHIGPWMQCHKLLREPYFFRAIESRHIALIYYLSHCFIHFRVPVPKRIGPDTHDAHVQQLATVKIPDMTAFGTTEIGRPPFG